MYEICSLARFSNWECTSPGCLRVQIKLYVITLEDISNACEDWINDGVLLIKDKVHLSSKGVKTAGDLTRNAVSHWGGTQEPP